MQQQFTLRHKDDTVVNNIIYNLAIVIRYHFQILGIIRLRHVMLYRLYYTMRIVLGIR